MGQEKNSGRKVSIKMGGQQVTKLGGQAHDLRDTYHLMLTLSWPRFFATVVGLYGLTNCVFAVLYLMGGQSITNARPGSFADAFFFSVETLATVGYGNMSPASFYGHAVATTEIFFGMFSLALMTGLVFARFAKPTAKVRFSAVAVVGRFNGKPALMFRMANERHSLILEAEVRMTLIRDEITVEGAHLRRFHFLKLERDRSPAFVLSWLVIHPIDESSPLFGWNPARLAQAKTNFIVTMTGLDELIAQTVHMRHLYLFDAIRFDHRFVDIVHTTAEGEVVTDLNHIDDVTPLVKSAATT
jgi:inward rectifier potassium channel